MLQYLLLLCAFAVPDIQALAIPVIEATAEDPKCLDITHCRTLPNIVWTCFVTIFACTWVSIHRNLVPDSGETINIPALLERVGITALTILVPEFTLAWAVRQWLVANEIAKQFKKPPVSPPHARATGIDADEENMRAVDRRDAATESTAQIKFATVLAALWKSVRSKFSNDNRWTTTHGFFVLMGGFCFAGDGSDHPASRDELEYLIQETPFEPPNKLDIDARSKSDAFSKIVTVLQTLWFIMQCIARAIQHLPITNLEITTLAYTTITFAMYRVWFQKPLNVSRPILLTRPILLAQLKRDEAEITRSASPYSSSNAVEELVEAVWKARIKSFIQVVLGNQDDYVHLSQLRQVPTFYAGRPGEHQTIIANAIALAVGAIFGAIHCIAWSFAFPSQAEQLLWRISAVITVVTPSLYVVFVVLMVYELQGLAKPVLILSTVGMPLYLVARAVLLVLTFTTLRDLLPAAYEAIHWMSFIPHV